MELSPRKGISECVALCRCLTRCWPLGTLPPAVLLKLCQTLLQKTRGKKYNLSQLFYYLILPSDGNTLKKAFSFFFRGFDHGGNIGP